MYLLGNSLKLSLVIFVKYFIISFLTIFFFDFDFPEISNRYARRENITSYILYHSSDFIKKELSCGNFQPENLQYANSRHESQTIAPKRSSNKFWKKVSTAISSTFSKCFKGEKEE